MISFVFRVLILWILASVVCGAIWAALFGDWEWKRRLQRWDERRAFDAYLREQRKRNE